MSFAPFPNDPGASPYPNNPGSSSGTLPQLVLTQLASDNFTRANSGSLGAGWSAGSDTGLTISSNEALGAASGIAADLRTDIYSGDHYSAVHIGSLHAVSGGYVGPTTRNDATGQNQYAALYVPSGPTVTLYKRIAGVYTAISGNATVTAPATGDILELISEGSQHTIYYQGAPLLTVTDTSIPGGTGQAPGLTTFNGMSINGWQGGNAATGALGAALQSDNFNRANNGMSVGQANWSPMTFADGTFGMVDCPIVSNELNTGAGTTGHNGDYRTSEAWPANQWAQKAIGSVPPTSGNNSFLGVVTRIQPAGNAGYFGCIFLSSPVNYRIYRLDHGTPDSSTQLLACLQNNLAIDPTGTVYTLLSVGSRHSLRINGKEIMAVTDTTYATGTPGTLDFTPSVTSDNWSAGTV